MVLNFTAPRYTLLFLYSEIYIVHVINGEWSKSVNFPLRMFCMWYKHIFFQHEKPKCLKIESKKGHSTLLKAFSKSWFRGAIPKVPMRFWWKVWKISCAMIELSWMFLPGIEVACHGVMSLGKRIFRWLAKVLEIIL